MEKYRYGHAELSLMENSCVPFAIYQFLDKRVVTLVLSAGFLETFGYTDRAAAYDLMDHDMYRDAHPDDVARIADAAVQFATAGVEYNVVYRTRKNGEYRIIHARGKHVYPAPEVRVAVVTYTDEGAYRPDAENRSALVSGYHYFGNDLLVNSERQQYIINNPDAKQSEIATKCGFLSASTFNTIFKKVTGMTPKMWVAARDRDSQA